MPIFNSMLARGANQPDLVTVKFVVSGIEATATYSDGAQIIRDAVLPAGEPKIHCLENSIIYVTGNFRGGADVVIASNNNTVVASHWAVEGYITSIPVQVLGESSLNLKMSNSGRTPGHSGGST